MPTLTVKNQGWERSALVMDGHAILAEVFTTTGRENQRQTAALFAAAPDLLAALRRLTHPMADDSDLEFARAVIAQATQE